MFDIVLNIESNIVDVLAVVNDLFEAVVDGGWNCVIFDFAFNDNSCSKQDNADLDL